MVTKIYGAPGTGKTTALIAYMKEHNLTPKDVCAMSYSRAAKDQLIEKAKREFPQAKDSDFSYWSTQHGINYRLLKLDASKIANFKIKEFTDKYRYKLSPAERAKHFDVENITGAFVPNDEKYVHQFLKTAHDKMRQTLQYDQEYERLKKRGFGFSFNRFVSRYTAWMEENGYTDFIGMIEKGIEKKVKPPVTAILIDEFQDMSPLQVSQIRDWVPQFQHIVIAGDDDQAIHTYAGADPTLLLTFPCDKEVVLSTTYRYGETTLQTATEVISRVKTRKEKIITAADPQKTSEITLKKIFGFISYLPELMTKDPQATIFILARNNYHVEMVKNELRSFGVPVDIDRDTLDAYNLMTQEHPPYFTRRHLELFASSVFPSSRYFSFGAKRTIKQLLTSSKEIRIPWEQGMSTLGLLSTFYDDYSAKRVSHLKGGHSDIKSLQKATHAYPNGTPHIEVMTIHSAKGKEADYVVILCDVTERTHEAQYGTPEDREAEARVWYVALTRCKKQNIIIQYASFGKRKQRVSRFLGKFYK